MARPMLRRQPCQGVLVDGDHVRVRIGERQQVVAVQRPDHRLVAVRHFRFSHFVANEDFQIARRNSEQPQAILVRNRQFIITLQHARGDDVVLEIPHLHPNQMSEKPLVEFC